ncbi:MAG: TolC family protein [Haliscomenobacter sp.]|nr:TolC family protein [Haliscomenobacter sp.]
MKIAFALLPLSLFFGQAFTQTTKPLDLGACYAAARKHAVLGGQLSLYQQQNALKLAQIDASRKPELTLNSKASMQTENVDLGIDNPLFQSPDLPLFQFRLTADAAYTLYDGGMHQAQREQELAALRVQEQVVEVELRKLHERINQPFFSILLLRKKIQVLENSRKDLLARSETLEGAVRAGARLQSEVERLQIQITRLEADVDKARYDIRAMFRILEALTGEQYDDQTELLIPDLSAFQWQTGLERPELRLFQLQQDQTLTAEQLLEARRKPKAGAFLQTGLGYPNPLNFFEDQLSPFALAGVQLSWKILDWEQTRRDRELLQVQRALIETQKAHFVQQLNLLDGKYQEDAAGLEALIRSQESIAQRQERIRMESAAQMEQGTLSATDYLSELNAELQTQIQLETYRLQIQQLKVDFLTLKGLL